MMQVEMQDEQHRPIPHQSELHMPNEPRITTSNTCPNIAVTNRDFDSGRVEARTIAEVLMLSTCIHRRQIRLQGASRAGIKWITVASATFLLLVPLTIL